MRILYFVGGISLSETFIYELALRLNESHECNIVSLSEPYYTKDLNYTLIKNDLPFNSAHNIGYIFETRGKKLVYKLKKTITSKKLKPLISNQDVVYIDYGTNATLILPLLLQLRIPFIVHFHGYDISSELNFKPYKEDLAVLFKRASFVIAASHHIKRLIILNGCDENKVKVVRYGISMPKLKGLAFEEKSIDFISIGRLTPKKNPLALLLAFNIVLKNKPDVNLHLIGDGPLMPECLDLMKKLNISDKVVIHGAMQHDNAMEMLRTSRIYVQHSVTSSRGDQEGFAISLAEAALLEIPVVSTYHNGIPENVIDGKTGFLVKEFDYETMASKMLELIENPSLMILMGQRGKAHIEELCNSDKRVSDISKLLETAKINFK